MCKILTGFLSFFMIVTVSHAQIVINEIMPSVPGTGEDEEYIELHNITATSINMTGYVFRDATANYVLGNVTISANGFVVIARDSVIFAGSFGFAPDAEWNGFLSGSEYLVLEDNSGNVLDSVFYASNSPWPTIPTTGTFGYSLQLCDPLSDNNIGTNWNTSLDSAGINNQAPTVTLYGTPGAANNCPAPPSYPIYSIGAINTSDVNGVADSLNVTCEIRGVVHSIDFDGNAGYDLTLIDYMHEGITVFSFTDVGAYTAPMMGDSIHVLGSVNQFNGLTQFAVDSIVLIQPGQPLLSPILLTTALNESNENKLVRINTVTLIDPAQWTGTGSGFNVDVTNGTTNWTLRIDNDCVWYGLPAPTGTLDIIGTVSQFDSSNPYDSGYQIRPRITSDIMTQGGSPTVIFNGNALTVDESAGTVTVTLNITNADANPTSVDVILSASSTATAADYTNFSSPVTVTFPGGSSAAQQVTIDIVDDASVETPETIVLELTNVTNNGALGADSIYTITINDNDGAPAPLANLVITEIMYNNPAADSVEFIEIYNNDTTSVDLSGYQLTNGIFITFPAFVMAPGDYVVVSQDSALFNQLFSVSTFQWNSGNSLNNTGEAIVLRNDQGAVLDSVFYSSSAPWPTGGAGNGPSIQLCDVNSDNADGTNWGASNNPTGIFVGGAQIFATPGAANSYCRMPYPIVSIGDIDNTNATGLPDSLGFSFEVRGVVHCGDFRVGTGLDFYLINYLNEGIKVFSSSDRGYVVSDGDSLHIWGVVSEGNGVTEFLVDSIFFISSGNPTVAPLIINTALTENNEGSLIQINNVSLVNATQWTGTGTGFNVDITNGSTNWQLRIDDAVDLFSQAAPTGSFNVYGIGNQFDPSAPYTSGYQLLACNSSISPVTSTVNTEIKEVKIFPNPVFDQLTINAENIESLSVLNMLGQEIISEFNISSNLHNLNTSTLPTGLYNIIVIANGERTVKQFVKK